MNVVVRFPTDYFDKVIFSVGFVEMRNKIK